MISKQSERSVKYHRDMARAALLLVLMLVVLGDLFTVSDARPGNTGAVPYSSRYLLLELGYDVERLQGRGSGLHLEDPTVNTTSEVTNTSRVVASSILDFASIMNVQSWLDYDPCRSCLYLFVHDDDPFAVAMAIKPAPLNCAYLTETTHRHWTFDDLKVDLLLAIVQACPKGFTFMNWFALSCHISRLINEGSFFGSLAKFNVGLILLSGFQPID
ncbi:hypothetical protein SAY86_024246 [Trapa natans]|uniref:Uncharacterized protein n=1 Tax=Trapa natans TaxID=22666 RepID=A0AAN7M4D9_TRANT|nr:hypothetical protein SAY86_024246 [Trapa natans]